MDERRRKPLWPWIVVTALALPVLYIASIGPACWLADRAAVHDFHGGLAVIYAPIVRNVDQIPSPVVQLISDYSDVGAEHQGNFRYLIEWHRRIDEKRP